jgi:hypothetical protein
MSKTFDPMNILAIPDLPASHKQGRVKPRTVPRVPTLKRDLLKTLPLQDTEIVPVEPAKPKPPPRPKPAKVHDRQWGSLGSVLSMLRGGQKTLINLVRIVAATSTEAALFISKYDALTARARKCDSRVSLEDLCKESGIEWPRLVGWACEAAMATGQHIAAMNAALSLPDVVEKSIKYAKERKGTRDREMLFQHSRFIPVPSGSTISILNQVAANAQAANSDAKAFVPFEQDIMEDAGERQIIDAPVRELTEGE